MTKTIDVAILGATGVVGETMISILEERNFPVGHLYPLASENSVGKTVLFQNKTIDVLDAATFDFSKAQIALFSAGGSVSKAYAPKATDAGCVVIDNTSEFRYEDDIPLVIPEVNPERIADYVNRNIIANPNCSTIQMLVALKPIYDSVGIAKINVATYQAVSGTGRAAISELIKQTGDLLNARPAEPDVYPKQIAFNVIPHIDKFFENGFTKEEMKMIWETQKILEDPEIIVNPTAVRVPVVYGHSEVISIETKSALTATQARALLAESEGVEVLDNPDLDEYPTPMSDSVGTDPVYIGRIRNELNNDQGLNLWVVSDNVRKGAALNSIQIAEILVNKYIML